MSHDAVRQLLATDVALDKLGARHSAAGVEQQSKNLHVTVRNPRPGGTRAKRVLLIGATDGGRLLTVVIERTVDPAIWLVVTGWASTAAERKVPRRRDEHRSLERPRAAAR
ncbi:MAG: hypothetical protein ACRDK0_02605 [Solirubrobacteraceae bacterium]